MKKILILLAFTFVAFVSNAQSQLCFTSSTDGQSVYFTSSHSTVTWIFGSNTPISTTSDTISYRFADSDTNSLQTVSMITNGDTLTKQVIVLSSFVADTIVNDTTITDTTTNIDGVVESNIDVSIFPNPIVNILNINLNDSYFDGIGVSVMDISGRIIITQTIYENTTLDVSSLNSGIYILSLNHNGSIKVEKILKR